MSEGVGNPPVPGLSLGSPFRRRRKESEPHFSPHVSDVAAEVWIDSAGTILRADAKVSEVFGYEYGELVGRDVAMLIPADIGKGHSRKLGAYSPFRVTDRVRNVSAKHKSGRVFPIALEVMEETDDATGGGPVFRGRISLVASENFKAVFTLGEDGMVLSCTGARVHTLFGYAKEEIIGQKLSAVLGSVSEWSGEDLADELWVTPGNHMVTVTHRDGSQFPVNLVVFASQSHARQFTVHLTRFSSPGSNASPIASPSLGRRRTLLNLKSFSSGPSDNVVASAGPESPRASSSDISMRHSIAQAPGPATTFQENRQARTGQESPRASVSDMSLRHSLSLALGPSTSQENWQDPSKRDPSAPSHRDTPHKNAKDFDLASLRQRRNSQSSPALTAGFACLLSPRLARTQASGLQSIQEGRFLQKTDSLGILESRWQIDREDVRFVRELGSGAFGVVWHGEFKGNDCVIKTHHENDGDMRQEVLSEALALSRLRPHASICAFFGIVMDPDYPPCLVLEYIEGGDLSNLLSDHAQYLTGVDVVSMAKDLSAGIRCLHDNGQLHLDLAPRNLLVIGNDPLRLRITDFGLSKTLAEGEDTISAEGTLLPWRWLDPNVVRTRSFSRASDVWSFGVCLWQMLSRERPYDNLKGNDEVRKFVVNDGGVLAKPAFPLKNNVFASQELIDELYEIMLACWRRKEKELTMAEASRTLNDLLAESADYLDGDASAGSLESSEETVSMTPDSSGDEDYKGSSSGFDAYERMLADRGDDYGELSDLIGETEGATKPDLSAKPYHEPQDDVIDGGDYSLAAQPLSQSGSRSISRPSTRPNSRSSKRPPSPLALSWMVDTAQGERMRARERKPRRVRSGETPSPRSFSQQRASPRRIRSETIDLNSLISGDSISVEADVIRSRSNSVTSEGSELRWAPPLRRGSAVEPPYDLVDYDAEELAEYLATLRVSQESIKLLLANHIDGSLLEDLDKELLEEIGVKAIGDRLKLLKIAKWMGQATNN